MFLEGSGLLVRNILAVKEFQIFGRHPQFIRGGEYESGVEIRHRLGEGVHCPAVFEVTDHIDRESVEGALSLADGVHVKEGLGRMLVGTVSGIDYRNRGNAGSDCRSSLHRMTHHNHIHIVGDNFDGILESFSLGNTGILGVREAYNSGSQTVDSRLERKSRPGGRLEEKAGYDLAGKKILLPVLFELPCYIKNVENLILCEILN